MFHEAIQLPSVLDLEPSTDWISEKVENHESSKSHPIAQERESTRQSSMGVSLSKLESDGALYSRKESNPLPKRISRAIILLFKHLAVAMNRSTQDYARPVIEMGKRPGQCYRECDRPAFVRKKYIHRRPASRIVSFDMGNPGGDFEVVLSLIGLERCQIRHQALEAARIASNRYMGKVAGRDNYHLRIRVKPHHYLRENKMISGAGADRVQDGMRKAWGKVIGSAARVKPNQPLITIRTNRDDIKNAMKALKKAAPKFPTPCKIRFDEIDPELKRKLGYGGQ